MFIRAHTDNHRAVIDGYSFTTVRINPHGRHNKRIHAVVLCIEYLLLDFLVKGMDFSGLTELLELRRLKMVELNVFQLTN